MTKQPSIRSAAAIALLAGAAAGYRQGDLRGAVSIKYRFERM